MLALDHFPESYLPTIVSRSADVVVFFVAGDPQISPQLGDRSTVSPLNFSSTKSPVLKPAPRPYLLKYGAPCHPDVTVL